MTTRLLVAHGEGLARAGIIQILKDVEDMSVVAQAATSSQMVQLSKQLRPDIAIVDGGSAELGRPDAIRGIAEFGATDVLLLTPTRIDGNILRMLTVGVVGLLPMDASPKDLLHALRLIATGYGFIDPAVIRPLVQAATYQTPEESITSDDRFAGILTPRERQVLACVGQGYSNMEIAQRFTLSENTVKTHVSRVLGKLGLRSRVEAALIVRNSWITQDAS
ncbi:LuxR C-terminal-related transcriptional regulator [Streptomyces tubercidicus]|uniref:LuxR C-terminal-related transcriptional regulator n=1 Tax=Streptomyces tubercidicus TaxID=47759 RepID=UPI003680F3C4